MTGGAFIVSFFVKGLACHSVSSGFSSNNRCTDPADNPPNGEHWQDCHGEYCSENYRFWRGVVDNCRHQSYEAHQRPKRHVPSFGFFPDRFSFGIAAIIAGQEFIGGQAFPVFEDEVDNPVEPKGAVIFAFVAIGVKVGVASNFTYVANCDFASGDCVIGVFVLNPDLVFGFSHGKILKNRGAHKLVALSPNAFPTRCLCDLTGHFYESLVLSGCGVPNAA